MHIYYYTESAWGKAVNLSKEIDPENCILEYPIGDINIGINLSGRKDIIQYVTIISYRAKMDCPTHEIWWTA